MRSSAVNNLGDFLRRRRAELQPADVGLPAPRTSRRRAEGLRREDVAALAAISADYYARIEQGRRRAPRETLQAIADALRLDKAGRDYLLELSGIGGSAPAALDGQNVKSTLLRLLDQLSDSVAVVMGPRLQVLAWNKAAASLIHDYALLPPHERNFVRLMFLEPHMRDLLPHWHDEARLAVAMLHMDVVRDPDHPAVAALVGELTEADPYFRQLWQQHQVVLRTHGQTEFHHPLAGDLTLEWSSLVDPDDPTQRLLFWNAAPESESSRRLAALSRPS